MVGEHTSTATTKMRGLTSAHLGCNLLPPGADGVLDLPSGAPGLIADIVRSVGLRLRLIT